MILECRGLEVAYGRTQVLFGVDVAVERGEVVALLGTNGAGKSTLLRAVAQLVPPVAGSIEFDGGDITRLGPEEAALRGIVYVPGDRAVFPSLTVAEHFTATSYLSGGIDDSVDLFPALRRRWGTRAGDLSGGEQRQLAMATALVPDAALLLVDELSIGLSPDAAADLLDVLRGVKDSGCSVLLVEQSLEVARQLADRVYFMEKGAIRFTGAPAQLAKRRDLLRPVFLRNQKRGGRRRHGPRTPHLGKPALEVRSLTKHYGGVAAVSDVSFDVPESSVIGLVGPNGAGKTTVLDVISGVVWPDAGTVTLAGRDITRLRPHRRARIGLGRSFQGGGLFPSLTVAEAVALAFESHLDVRDHLASTLALPAARAMERKVARDVETLLELLELGPYREVRMSELSSGTRRVVELAMAIAHRPRVLLLDEPSAGLAQPERAALVPVLLRVRDETGCSMLVVEHDVPLISAIADDLVALDAGRVARTA